MLISAHAGSLPLADESVQCVVTSPPYWGLRKYKGEQVIVWDGDASCQHDFTGEYLSDVREETESGKSRTTERFYGEPSRKFNGNHQKHFQTHTCRCGAWRGAYGLEPTIEAYVSHTVIILRELWRVLRKDGVLFWNIGDSYARDPVKGDRSNYLGLHKNIAESGCHKASQHRGIDGLKPKDLCLIPSRVALAAQADGWWMRSMIVWAKPNPMPESVTDRPTAAYEHILMLTKSERYYWDADAVKEPCSPATHARISQDLANQVGSYRAHGGDKTNGPMKSVIAGSTRKLAEAGSGIAANRSYESALSMKVENRNMRNVWTFPTQPYSGAHFATFPEEIPKRCILAASKIGDVVLDPFAGSGTTGRVAIALQRRPVLVDLAYSAEYRDLAVKRTREVQIEMLSE
jgi:DNA modification methylase